MKTMYSKMAQLLAVLAISTSALSADTLQPQAPIGTVDSSGNQVVVWELDDLDTATSSIQSAYNIGAGWTTGADIPGSAGGFDPQSAGSSGGDVFTCWRVFDSVNQVYTLMVAHFSPLTGWETPVQITSPTYPNYLMSFDIHVNDAGQGILSINVYNPNTNLTELWTTTATGSGSWSSPVQIF